MQERRTVGSDELPFEFMMNALRLNEGFPSRLFEERTGLPLTAIQAELRAARREGLLEMTAQQIAPSEQGRRFLNRLLLGFLPDR